MEADRKKRADRIRKPLVRKRNAERFGQASGRGFPLKITVKAFGQIMEVLGAERTVVLPEKSTIEDLSDQLEECVNIDKAQKREGLLRSDLTVLVNGRNVRTLKNRTLRDGDFVAFLSPFGGG